MVNLGKIAWIKHTIKRKKILKLMDLEKVLFLRIFISKK